MHTKLKRLLELAVNNKASDLHLSSDVLPKMRIDGILGDVTVFSTEEISLIPEMILSMLDENGRKNLENNKEIDFSLSLSESRFRVNIFFQKGMLGAVLRVIPSEIPSLDSLNLPSVVGSLCREKQGFVLVAGPTGQGKSTTVASMLNEINLTRGGNIVTVEDPIEYLIKGKKSVISQRELGRDTLSFPRALRSCLRQDPNVVFVGEMRDLETIGAALTVAETGHLVFSTLHTNSASQTVDRIIDVFPEESKAQVKLQLASVLTAVISQRLLPTVDGGRIPAVEIMIATMAVKNAIREGKTYMIDNIIQTSADVGMISLETSLAKLVKGGGVTEKVALSYTLKKSELLSRLRGGVNL
ncbi:type IV pili twitching motility protein PilT [Candidatus Shapirobacteria bacterium]|nr:MAG: type IV pili twitching motility protein PilT [Candidatus Shapirobacteria bacterium]